MRREHFDDEIRHLLRDLDVPFQAEHWDDLSHRLRQVKEANTPDARTAFDKEVSHKIKDFETPFVEAHWLSLYWRLVRETYINKWVITTKITEAFLILIMALSFVQTNRFHVYPHNGNPIPPSIHQPAPPTHNNTDRNYARADQIPPGPSPRRRMAPKDGRHTPRLLAHRPNHQTVPPIAAPLIRPLPAPPPALPARKTHAAPQTAAILPALPRTGTHVQPPSAPLPSIVAAQRQNAFFLDVFTALAGCRIITGTEPFNDINPPDLAAISTGAGITIGKTLARKYLAKVGISFSQLHYRPAPIIRITNGDAATGYAGWATRDIHVKQLRIPVSIEGKLLHRGKHRFYWKAGAVPVISRASFHQQGYYFGDPDENQIILLDSDLSTSQQTAYVAPKTDRQAAYPANPSLSTQSDQAVVVQDQLIALGRIGIDYSLSRYNYDLNLGLHYDFQLSNNGIGLPKDKINALEFQAGLRFWL